MPGACRLLMVPTTLLAQVDSSVGGKVGINHPRAKNIIGAFHQPIGVWIDTETLESLPDRELRCGLAEVVKYGVILDGEFFAELEDQADQILERHDGALRRIVARSCQLKAGVVSRDEREETGLRAVLNFGHTIGHAIESVAGYGGSYQHGEAVAVGMVAEGRLARAAGLDRTRRRGSPSRPAGPLRPADVRAGTRRRPADRRHGPRQEEPRRPAPVRLAALDRSCRADRHRPMKPMSAPSWPVFDRGMP